MDLIRIKFANFNKMLDFSHANLSAGCDHWVKISGRFVVNEIAGLVGLPCFYDRNFGGDPGLEHIINAIEFLSFLTFGEFCAEAGASVEARNPCAAGAQPFGQRALRNELKL